MIGETVAEAARRRPGLRTAGLLAASGCLYARLYEKAFEPLGVGVVSLGAADQSSFMDLVALIKANRVDAPVRSEMRRLAEVLTGAGAELIVAGCTEVPLVLRDEDVAVPLISSTDVLVDRTLGYAVMGDPLPR
jgi:aspartate racemase